MKHALLLGSLLVTPAVSAVSQTPEALHVNSQAAFSAAAGQATPVPLHLQGKAQALTCQAQVRNTTMGFGGRCSFGTVVTEVQILGGVVQLRCAEIEVTCR